MEERSAGNLHVPEASTSTAYRPTTFTAVRQQQRATPRVTPQHPTCSSLRSCQQPPCCAGAAAPAVQLAPCMFMMAIPQYLAAACTPSLHQTACQHGMALQPTCTCLQVHNRSHMPSHTRRLTCANTLPVVLLVVLFPAPAAVAHGGRCSSRHHGAHRHVPCRHHQDTHAGAESPRAAGE
jgi:hypothetical protein